MANGASRKLFWGIAAAVVLADFVTKLIAVATLSRLPVRVIGDFVTFQLVYNPGAAFGIHVGAYSRWVFMALALLALVVLGSMVRETTAMQWVRLTALGAVCGGAVGNLIDRFRSARGVVDFIDVGVGNMRWPTFNVADMAVTCGAVVLAVVLWTEGRDSDERAHDPAAAPVSSSS
ncbi:MAG: signal peptidase II [Gemmatimonadetes bacterium]|nr:signal peptidase II [Gemmatimonadota bacterium]